MTPSFTVALWVSLVGLVAAAAFTVYAHGLLSRSPRGEDRQVAAGLDSMRRSRGMSMVAVALFVGLIWPIVVGSYLIERRRRE